MLGPTVIDIWPGLAPGETTSLGGARDRLYDRKILLDITRPELKIYRPDDTAQSRPALLVLPGGGYEFISDDHEGDRIAQWLCRAGYVAAVLTYRVPDRREGAFADAVRAMRLLRHGSDAYGIDPSRLGTIGISAGAHLAARLCACLNAPIHDPTDEIDQVESCPAFALLIYPAYLLGDDRKPAVETAPHYGQPPLFIMQTEEDPFACSKEYAAAARRCGIDVRLIIYKQGLHGYGLDSSPDLDVSNWPKEAEKWLQEKLA